MNCSALTIWLSQPCWVSGNWIGVAGTNRATVWAELLSSGYSTATRLTRWEMRRGVRPKKMIEGCQCSVPYLDAYIKMIWTDFWLSSVHFPGNFHPSNGFFQIFQGWNWGNVHLDAASTLRSLHDAWTPGKFVLAFNGVLSNTSHLVLRCDCCGVESLVKDTPFDCWWVSKLVWGHLDQILCNKSWWIWIWWIWNLFKKHKLGFKSHEFCTAVPYKIVCFYMILLPTAMVVHWGPNVVRALNLGPSMGEDMGPVFFFGLDS